MSYDLNLLDPITKEVIELSEPHHRRGGTYCVGGEKRACFNITWNYAEFLYRVLSPNGIRTIYGMTGADSIPVLEKAISQLGDDVTNRYWYATEGNAKRALSCVLALAKMRPDGIWDGD